MRRERIACVTVDLNRAGWTWENKSWMAEIYLEICTKLLLPGVPASYHFFLVYYTKNIWPSDQWSLLFISGAKILIKKRNLSLLVNQNCAFVLNINMAGSQPDLLVWYRFIIQLIFNIKNVNSTIFIYLFLNGILLSTLSSVWLLSKAWGKWPCYFWRAWYTDASQILLALTASRFWVAA